MLVVTGGGGFVGSHLTRSLVDDGRDVMLVDDWDIGAKLPNIADVDVADFVGKDEFVSAFEGRSASVDDVEAVFHEGAITDTTVTDGPSMLSNNFGYGKRLLDECQRRRIPFIYASSAAVYGTSRATEEDAGHENPLNLYAYSKLMLDRYVRKKLPNATGQIVGLRYFNVYGPREAHKGKMASLVHQLHGQLVESGRVRLFGESHGVGPGEQRRDFVHVDDVVGVNRFFLEHPGVCGVFNVGTGRSRTFNELAQAVLDFHGRGKLEYLPFPSALGDRYQAFTEANITALRAAGYPSPFIPLEDGVKRTLKWFSENTEQPSRSDSPSRSKTPLRSEAAFQELASLVGESRVAVGQSLDLAASTLSERVAAGGRVFTCGNGGSAAHAQHLAAELVGCFERVRPGHAAVALTTDGALLTSLANDFGYEAVFSRQLQSLATAADVLVVFSTSGRSKNVLAATAQAKKVGCPVVAFTGEAGSELGDTADIVVAVPSTRVARIQEIHQLCVHVLAEVLDQRAAE